jgi:hypothetical protein
MNHTNNNHLNDDFPEIGSESVDRVSTINSVGGYMGHNEGDIILNSRSIGLDNNTGSNTRTVIHHETTSRFGEQFTLQNSPRLNNESYSHALVSMIQFDEIQQDYPSSSSIPCGAVSSSSSSMNFINTLDYQPKTFGLSSTQENKKKLTAILDEAIRMCNELEECMTDHLFTPELYTVEQ